MPGVDVVSIVDPDPEKLARARRVVPGAVTRSSFAEAVDSTALDFACLAIPVPALPSLALQAVEAGVPSLIEKPTAPSEEEALAVIEEAERQGVMICVGHVERFNPAVRALKRKLGEGAIGRIYQVHARRLSPFPRRDSMLGVALDLATHDIDVIRFLTDSEVERVFAETARRVHHETEDLICATLRLDNGITALLEVNWLTPTKVRQLNVTGEGGMFVVDYLTQDLCFYENPSAQTEWETLSEMRGVAEGDMIRYALDRREPLLVQWEAFLQALRTGSPPPVSAYEGLAALSTARAIQAAGDRHETVLPSYRTLAAT